MFLVESCTQNISGSCYNCIFNIKREYFLKALRCMYFINYLSFDNKNKLFVLLENVIATIAAKCCYVHGSWNTYNTYQLHFVLEKARHLD